MGKKLLIDKSKRNLLIFSDFMKHEEPALYKILLENNKIDEDTAEKLDISQKIKQNLPAWLNFSSQEWISDKSNPILTTDESGNKHCKLCNQSIKFQYKIKNQKNDMEILIGGNCVNNFKQLDSMIKIIKTEEEYRRYNKLLKYNSDIFDILMSDSKYLQKTAIILPKGYYDSFDKIQKKINKMLKSYIRKGKKIKKSELDRALVVYNYEQNNLTDFIKKHEPITDYVTRKTANEIENKQNDEYKNIINEVMENNGKLSPFTSIKIKVESHLERMKCQVNNHLPVEVEIVGIFFGTFVLSIQKFNDKYNFKIDSSLLLENFFRKKLQNFDTLFLENRISFEVHDVATREKLAILTESFIVSDNSFRIKEIDYRKIANRYDDDLTSNEFNEVINRIMSILEKYTIFEKKGATHLYIYKNSVLEEYGKELLLSQLDSTKKKIIKSYEIKMEIKELYDWVIGRLN
ncbi:hypothetical protein [uncultured Enterococcus sp.]|uniref:hypothetical protein n=1 Tax=uncultured Enterococcus sp. TaxID=167972 RepID=UPI002805B4E5|nr:hypothetical protein [uncultured Enterococcus sp.]